MGSFVSSGVGFDLRRANLKAANVVIRQ